MALTKTGPASMPSMNCSVSRGSKVQTLAARPNGVPFASSIAAAASRTRKTAATGPNVSSHAAGASWGRSVSTVGA